MNMDTELQGKCVIVTGGTMGIGFGMATRLAQRGANVVITSRHSETGEEALARLRQAAGVPATRLAYVPMDICSEADNERLVQRAVEIHGRLDAIINNAVYPGDFQLLADESLTAFEQVMRTNVTGTYLGMRFAIRQFLAQGAGPGTNYSIINISSGATRDVSPRMGPYIASKRAVEGLTQAAAVEYSRQGIRVNTLLFGVFETEKSAKLHAAMPAVLEKNLAKHHIGRLGDAERDAGEAAVFLVSERSAFITGSTLHVDGGMCL
jgi:NAD(P)-dependent dehydrogenase (short-subunit alcohol dehydrogenase family)